MARIRQIGQGLNTLEDISKALSLLSHEIDKQLSNGLTFTNNMDMVAFTVADSGNADTAIPIAHGLGRAPIGFIVTNRDKAGVVYTSGSSLGNISGTNLFCDVANVAFNGFIF